MRLTQIRDLLAIAESGSIRKAARSMGVSQPAMTKSVQLLESELGTQLLHRTSRGAVATRLGKVFLAHARVIQAELRKAEQALSQPEDRRGGRVAIGVSPTATVLVVDDVLRRLQATRPRCSVHVIEGVWSSLLPRVRDETLDLAIVLRTPDAKLNPAVRFKPLFSTNLVVAGRRGHPLRAARSLRELAAASWLMFGPPGHAGLLARFFAAADLPPPRVTIQCESYAAALALLARTDTLGLVTPQLLAEPYTVNLLQQIRVSQPTPAVTVGMLTRAGTPLTATAAAAARAVVAATRRFAALRAAG